MTERNAPTDRAQAAILAIKPAYDEVREAQEGGSIRWSLETLERWIDRTAGVIRDSIGPLEARRFRTVRMRPLAGLTQEDQFAVRAHAHCAHLQALLEELLQHPEAPFLKDDEKRQNSARRQQANDTNDSAAASPSVAEGRGTMDKRALITTVAASLVTAVITAIATVLLTGVNATINDEQVENVAGRLVNDVAKRNVLLRRMSESGYFGEGADSNDDDEQRGGPVRAAFVVNSNGEVDHSFNNLTDTEAVVSKSEHPSVGGLSGPEYRINFQQDVSGRIIIATAQGGEAGYATAGYLNSTTIWIRIYDHTNSSGTALAASTFYLAVL